MPAHNYVLMSKRRIAYRNMGADPNIYVNDLQVMGPNDFEYHNVHTTQSMQNRLQGTMVTVALEFFSV